MPYNNTEQIPQTIRESLDLLTAIFKKHDLENPLFDACQIVAHHAGIPHLELNLHYDRILDSQVKRAIEESAERRARYEPLQYIFGEACFMGLCFRVTNEVLIPRPETELLVEKILNENERELSLLDIGTGSGNIAVSIAKSRTHWEIVATDISPQALDIARQNAERNGVEIDFYLADLFPAIDKSYDVIVSNPPYIPELEYRELSPEVREFEPQNALLAEEEGLSFYRRILEGANNRLKPGGVIYFEIGYNQGERIKGLAGRYNYRVIDIIRDYQQFDRVVKLTPG